jgi:hypothetical protein
VASGSPGHHMNVSFWIKLALACVSPPIGKSQAEPMQITRIPRGRAFSRSRSMPCITAESRRRVHVTMRKREVAPSKDIANCGAVQRDRTLNWLGDIPKCFLNTLENPGALLKPAARAIRSIAIGLCLSASTARARRRSTK